MRQPSACICLSGPGKHDVLIQAEFRDTKGLADVLQLGTSSLVGVCGDRVDECRSFTAATLCTLNERQTSSLLVAGRWLVSDSEQVHSTVERREHRLQQREEAFNDNIRPRATQRCKPAAYNIFCSISVAWRVLVEVDAQFGRNLLI